MNAPVFPPQVGNGSAVEVKTVPASVPAETKKDLVLSLKASREKLIATITTSPNIPEVWRAVLLAEIEVIHPKHDLLRLDFVRHAHGAGVNFSATVKEIS